MKHKYFYIITIIYFLTNFLTAQDGVLDSTFGTGGFVRTAFDDGSRIGYSMAIQEDGKIIVVGSFVGGGDLFLVRYNLDGSLDTSFDANGIVFLKDGGRAYDLALQADGKIVVLSSFRFMQLIRYNNDGSLDASFGLDGKVSTSFQDIEGGAINPRSLVIQSDGKIIVAGWADKIGKYNFILARYNIDGSLDASFDDDGRVIIDFGEGEKANSVALQADGKIIVAGETGFSDFVLVRYNTNGSLDASFGLSARVVTPIGTNDDVANDLVIQPDGKIVVAGYSKNSTDEDFALVRYNTDGSLDASFDTDGIVITDFNSGRSDFAQSMVIQSDGKIVLAGYSNGESSFDQNLALARFNVDGSLDVTFNSDGKVNNAFSRNTHGRSVAIQSDGKIVVAGDYNNYEFFVARYNNPSLANTYVVQIDNNIPKGFELSQNYPNPFNPTTTINYSISSVEAQNFASVQLKIYDVLGKEIATLVNEVQSPGNYKVDFDASKFSSGLYFYKIEAGNFVQMRKMILLK